MSNSTRRLFGALRRRSTEALRIVVLLTALGAMVALSGFSPGALGGRSAADVGPATALGQPIASTFGAERIAAETTTIPPTTTTSAPASVGASVVPDPRPGDLRLDPAADLLPVGYVAAPATDTIRDIAYGPDDRQRLDLYLPAEPNAPVIVYIHHGGWTSGDRREVPEMVLRFLERGYAVASVGYRLAPEHPFPAPVHDIKRAVRELKALGADTNLIDGDALVLYGISAGGQLAAFTAATVGEFEPEDLTGAQAAHDSGVIGIIVNVGPTDLVQMHGHPHDWAQPMSRAHAGCDPCTQEQLELPSPINHIGKRLPPAYWVYGGEDPLIDAELQGRRMADAWAEAAGPELSWLDLVDGESHVLDETMINQRQLEEFVDIAVGR